MNFDEKSEIGKVTAVDTSRVLVNVDDHRLLTRVMVGQLLALQGSTPFEYLIGIIERVTRVQTEEFDTESVEADGSIPIVSGTNDALRAILVGTFRSLDGLARHTFKRGADSFPQIERSCYLLEGENLQLLMNSLSQDVPENRSLTLGKYLIDACASAVADGDRFFQRHASILGSTGSGKSWTVALVLERAAQLKHPNIIVFDMHGEYRTLTKAEGGYAQGFRIAGPGDLETDSSTVLFLPYWLLNREEMLALLLDRSDVNAPNQATRFTSEVRSLKERRLNELDKPEVLATFTVDSPIPYSLEDLLAKLHEDNRAMVPGSAGREKQGEWYDKLTRFIARLEAKAEDRRYGFMFQPPRITQEYGWLASVMKSLLDSAVGSEGIKVIDFSEVPSDVLPIVVGVLARLIYDVQFWMPESKRTPLSIVCDEAHLYLPVREDTDSAERRALDAFERIAKEGRKYGVSLLVVSQRPADVSRTILSQCNNFLVLRLTNDQDQNVVRRLMPDTMAGLTEALPLLDIGEAFLLGDAVALPTRIKLDKPSLPPASATRDFWLEWQNMQPDPIAIAAAVEALRRQTKSRESGSDP